MVLWRIRFFTRVNRLSKIPMLSSGVHGTHESLLQAANFIQAVEERQGIIISSPEEIAYRMGFIDRGELRRLASPLGHNHYGQFLLRLLEDEGPPLDGRMR